MLTTPSSGLSSHRVPALTSTLNALLMGSSACITLLGDETGNETTEWFRVLAGMIGTRYPELRIIYQLYEDANNRYGSEEIVRMGRRGERYINMVGVTPRYQSGTAIGAVTGDVDIRVKAQHASWLPTATFSLHAHWGPGGNRGRNLWVNTNGSLVFSFSQDGTAQINASSSAPIPAPANPSSTPIWLRATRVASTGVVQFFTGTEAISKGVSSVTWTKLGNDVASTTGSIFASTAEYSIGGRGNQGGPWSEVMTGKIYAAIDRNGIDGPIINPQSIDSWYATNHSSEANTVEGSPTLYLRNGSLPGGTLAGVFNNTTKRSYMVTPYEPGLVLLSVGINEGTIQGKAYEDLLDGWLSGVRGRAPLLQPVIITQYPFIAPRTDLCIVPQRYRATQVPFWASRVGIPCIDTYSAFVNSGVALEDLISGTATSGNGSNLLTEGTNLLANSVLRALNPN